MVCFWDGLEERLAVVVLVLVFGVSLVLTVIVVVLVGIVGKVLVLVVVGVVGLGEAVVVVVLVEGITMGLGVVVVVVEVEAEVVALVVEATSFCVCGNATVEPVSAITVVSGSFSMHRSTKS